MIVLTIGEPVYADPATVKQRYDAYCSVCHGDNGDGASHARQGLVPPPRDFTDAGFATSVTRKRLIGTITYGVPGTAMVAWRTEFDSNEIAELADYILTTFVSTEPAQLDNTAARTYRESCSVCHGDDGKGAVWGQQSLSITPRNFTTREARNELTRDRMIVSVTHGRPGTPMPGFASQLSEQQVAAVVDYVRARFMSTTSEVPQAETGAMQRAHETPAGYHEQPFTNGLSGDFDRGRALYLANCTQCHGAFGDGDGPRAYFIFPKPRNFLDPATQQIFNRPRLFDGIRNGVVGREMPAWGKVLEGQDIADIAEFVYREFIRANANPVDTDSTSGS